MRAELPWNVAGIPPEAREAARAAARREGLSVGEWLTRRILRNLSGLEGEASVSHEDAPLDSWGLPQSETSRRDSEEMLAHVGRTETESNGLAYAKYDRFFTQKWYAYANSTFEHDKFRDIQMRTTLGVGSGYQWIASSRTNLALEGGLDYVYTNYYVSQNDQFPAMRVAVRFDHYLLPDKLQFFLKSEGYMSLESVKKSFARASTGLRMPISGNFVATTQYDVAWDGDPQPGRVSTDRTLLFTLGYKW